MNEDFFLLLFLTKFLTQYVCYFKIKTDKRHSMHSTRKIITYTSWHEGHVATKFALSLKKRKKKEKSRQRIVKSINPQLSSRTTPLRGKERQAQSARGKNRMMHGVSRRWLPSPPEVREACTYVHALRRTTFSSSGWAIASWWPLEQPPRKATLDPSCSSRRCPRLCSDRRWLRRDRAFQGQRRHLEQRKQEEKGWNGRGRVQQPD